MIERHHLLECILWPNGDGTFRKIINRAKRLQDLGIYDDYKLTIPLDKSTHQTLHREFEKGTEYERIGEKCGMYGVKGKNHPASRLVGEKNPWYGKGYLMSGDKHPMYGRTGEKAPGWKGDDVGPSGLYRRQLKRYKAGEITESEFQQFSDAYHEDQLKRKRMRKRSSSV